MRVFLSWSGQSSREVADCFHAWIPRVIQAVEPYLSSQDIEKGERWLSSISSNLESIDFGIVVVTSSNVTAPWINFEAGALSKKIDRARIIPVLFDITDADLVNHPLSQFQYVKLDREDIHRLFRVLNQSSIRPLPETQFEETFDLWFDRFFSVMDKIKKEKSTSAGVEKKSISKEDADARLQRLEAAIDELLNLQRRQSRRSETDFRSLSDVKALSDLKALSNLERDALRNIIVHAPPGSGKSHLLSEMLVRWLKDPKPDGGGDDQGEKKGE